MNSPWPLVQVAAWESATRRIIDIRAAEQAGATQVARDLRVTLEETKMEPAEIAGLPQDDPALQGAIAALEELPYE